MTTALVIILGMIAIILLVFVCFQLTKPDHLKLKINCHALELELTRAPRPPSRRPTKRLPMRR